MEAEHCRRIERLAGAEDGAREVRLVGAVGEVLGFERETVALAVAAVARAGERAGQEVAGVELDARLGRADLQDAPGAGLGDPRGLGERARPPPAAVSPSPTRMERPRVCPGFTRTGL